MTDKHSKDMTTSELLRWLADDDDQSNCQACSRFYASDECGGKMCSDWKRDLADKIDAELAEARELSLRRGAELWAKANGWPDFKDGENFGGWLERCAIPRPRFEDGEPVQFGDDTDELDGVEKFIFLRNGGWCQMQDADGNICNVFHGKRVKRRAPEVLGADGLPLNEDDTAYGTGREQHRYTVQVPYSINEEVGKRFCVQCYDHDEGNITWCDPSMLTHERPVLGADGKPIVVGETVYRLTDGTAWKVTKLHHSEPRISVVSVGGKRVTAGGWFLASEYTHTPPDTQEKIDRDKHKTMTRYWECEDAECYTCPCRFDGKKPSEHYGVFSCEVAQGMDIARRQAELGKRTGGAE